MKRIFSLIVVCLLAVPSSMMAAQDAPISAWHSWFTSLRRPTRQDVLRANKFVKSKWRCMVRGRNCSAIERNSLRMLAAAVAAAIVKGLHSRHKKQQKKKQDEQAQQLIAAAWHGDLLEVNRLLAVPGIDVNATNDFGETALIMAVVRGHENIVGILLAAPGIDVNLQGEYGGWPALMHAVYRGDEKIVRDLLAAPGINVNAKDNYGETALIKAAWRGYEDIVARILAAPGIDVNVKSNDGETALDIARSGNNSAIIELLEQGPIRSLTKSANKQ